jgi:CheY-like chemotaxis protein
LDTAHGYNRASFAEAFAEAVMEQKSPRRIVVADDNEDSAESFAMLLSFSGHEVRVAHDGAAALDAVRDFRPDVAFLDIGMPGLTGYEVAEAVRAEPWGNEVTLIAVTGWGQPDDRLRARTAGFDRHLIKPIDPAEVDRLLDA